MILLVLKMLKEIELENKWNEQNAYRSNLNKLQKKDASKSLYKIFSKNKNASNHMKYWQWTLKTKKHKQLLTI